MADFQVQDEGTLYLLRPITEAAIEWVMEHIDSEHTEFGGAIVVEHRYIEDIIVGIKQDGLEVALV